MPATTLEINLSPQQIANALKRAIENAHAAQQQAHALTYQQDIADNESSLPTTSDISSPSSLEIALRTLDELAPAAKHYFLDAVVAEYYGVNYTPNKSPRNLVLLENRSSELEKITEEFPKKIGVWSSGLGISPVNYDIYGNSAHDILKNTTKTLSLLAKANVLEKDNVQIYLAALDKIDDALGVIAYYNRNNYLDSSVGVWTYFIAFLSNSPQYANEKYKLALLEHVKKNASNLEFDINIAIDYSKRLQGQLAQENVYINEAYQGKEKVILQHLTMAKNNLSFIYATLKELKN